MKKLLLTFIICLVSHFSAFAGSPEVFETPSEIFVKTDSFDVCIWKSNIYNAQIHVYSGQDILKIFPCFYFGSNSSDRIKVGLFNRNNHYQMFLGKAENVSINDTDEYVEVDLSFPNSVISRDRSRPLSGTLPSADVFTAENNIRIYKNTPRIDIKSSQFLKEDMYTHISWFSQLYGNNFDTIRFGTEDGFETRLEPWSELKFMYKTPEGTFEFMRCDSDEKPPFYPLAQSRRFDDYFVLSGPECSYLVFLPSWSKYASKGYNRKKFGGKGIPDNAILFHSMGQSGNARIILIAKDTTLGQGRDVLLLPAGEYTNEMTLYKLNDPLNEKNTKAIVSDLKGDQEL